MLLVCPVPVLHCFAFTFCWIFFAAGCVSYHPRLLEPAQMAAACTMRRLPAGQTWTAESLVRWARDQHPDVNVARAKLATAQAAITTAGQRPNPTLAWSPTIVANPGDMSPWALGFSLDIPIETAGKRGKRVALAAAQVRMAALDLAQAQFQAGYDARKAFADLIAARRKARVLQRQQTAQGEVVKLFDARVQAGAISRPEVMQSRLLLQQTRLLVRDAERKTAEAAAALAKALGVSAEAVQGLRVDEAGFDRVPQAMPPLKARALALGQRSDLLSSLAGYAVAEASLRLEVAKQYPDVHLTPGYQYDQGANKWTLPGITAPLPIFDRNAGPIAEAVAKRSEAGAMFQAQQAKVIADVDQALASHRGALAKLKEAEDLCAEQKVQSSGLEAQLKAGEIDRLPVASATVEFTAAEAARLDALADVQATWLDLARAMQSQSLTLAR